MLSHAVNLVEYVVQYTVLEKKTIVCFQNKLDGLVTNNNNNTNFIKRHNAVKWL